MESNSISFSIITCTYNAEATLARTLDSVASQTYKNIQHIIIDGASSDGTMDMVRNYHSTHDNVLVVCEKDNGLYDAMNKGLVLAQGTYLVFLNAGDTLHGEGLLERLAEHATEMPGILYGNTDIVDNNGYFLHTRRLQPPENLTWKSFRDGMLVCHQAFYARTDIAQKEKYNLKYRYSADVDWCIRVMKRAQQAGLPLHNTHITLCNYLDEGLTTANHRASLLERFDVMRRHYGLMSTVAKHVWFIFRKK